MALDGFMLDSMALLHGMLDMTRAQAEVGCLAHLEHGHLTTLPGPARAGSHTLGRCAQPHLLACPQSMD